MDVITPEQRSAIMSRIRSKDTTPELIVRRLAHALGYRFRLHVRNLPGVPDLVFPRHRKVVFVHGCFWHQHPGCRFAYKPKSNVGFWQKKFAANLDRDAGLLQELEERDWTSLVIWECETSDLKTLAARMTSHLKHPTY